MGVNLNWLPTLLCDKNVINEVSLKNEVLQAVFTELNDYKIGIEMCTQFRKKKQLYVSMLVHGIYIYYINPRSA